MASFVGAKPPTRLGWNRAWKGTRPRVVSASRLIILVKKVNRRLIITGKLGPPSRRIRFGQNCQLFASAASESAPMAIERMAAKTLSVTFHYHHRNRRGRDSFLARRSIALVHPVHSAFRIRCIECSASERGWQSPSWASGF